MMTNLKNQLHNMPSEKRFYTLQNLPKHLIDANQDKKLASLLTNIDFIEAKCTMKMIYDLIADYNSAINSLFKTQNEKQAEREHEEKLRKYIKDLIAYSNGDIGHLEILPSVKPWSDKEIKANTERIINNPTHLDKIQAFSQFVNYESYGLVNFGHIPGYFIQQAYNYANSGPVVRASEHVRHTNTDDILLLRASSRRRNYFPHSALIKTLYLSNVSISAKITQDNKKVVSGDSDGCIRIWDIETGECIRVLEGHTGLVGSVDITPDGRRSVSGDSDGCIRIWDIETGECIRVLEGHTGPISSTCITADGKKVVAVNYNLRLWDSETGECFKDIQCYRKVQILTGYRKRTASWTAAKYSREGRFYKFKWVGRNSPVITISITPDGNKAVTGDKDGDIIVWDIGRGGPMLTLKGHKSAVNTLVVTPDGKWAVSGSDDKTIRLWNIEEGKCVRTMSWDFYRGGHIGSVGAVDVTPDGKIAVSGGYEGKLMVWNLCNGKCIKNLWGHRDEVLTVSVTPDGRRALSGGSDNTLRLWDIERGMSLETSEIQGQQIKQVYSISITSDLKSVISGSQGGFLHMWNFEGRKCPKKLFRHLAPISCVSATQEGKRVVWGSIEQIGILDIKSKNCLRMIARSPFDCTKFINSVNWYPFSPIFYATFVSLAISPDGKRILAGTTRGDLGVWDIETGKCVRILEEGYISDESVRDTITNMTFPHGKWSPFSAKINKQAFQHLMKGASTATMGLLALACQTQDGFRVGKRLHTKIGTNVCITPDGKIAISGGKGARLRAWNLETGECIGTFIGHTDDILTAGITPNGKKIVTGGVDRTIRIWDIKTRECILIIEGHTKAVLSISIVPDGKRLLSIGMDNTLRLWELNNGKCIAGYDAHSSLSSISQIKAGGRFACGTGEGEVIFFSPYRLLSNPLIATAVRIRRYQRTRKFLFPSVWRKKKQQLFCWDDDITALCQWCGRRFSVADSILDVIRAIARNADLSPKRSSSCLDLPAEAWHDPQLLCECSYCRMPLRFNPFIVDNRD